MACRNYFYYLGKKSVWSKIFVLLVLISLVSFIFSGNFPKNSDQKQIELIQLDSNAKISESLDIFQNPYTINFTEIYNFFKQNYESDLDYVVPIYLRSGDNLGVITDNTSYSYDNLFLYNTLLKGKMTASDLYSTYLELKNTPLYSEINLTQFQYGFIHSMNGTTGEEKDTDRYLIENLLPIFLLIENIGNELNSLVINDRSPNQDVEEMFKLINSTEFYDSTNKGFYHYNSSTTAEKYTEDNLYSILANLLIKNTPEVSSEIRNRAYSLANETIDVLFEKMWDSTNLGFYKNTDDETWTITIPGPGDDDKYLSVNALGIWVLSEYYANTKQSIYLTNASLLYDKIVETLWNSTYEMFEYKGNKVWGQTAPPGDLVIDLESNAVMMSACSKLFEITGNYSYYNRTIQLFESIEKYFFNHTLNAYNTTHADNSKNLNTNLKLCEAHLNAKNVYDQADLVSNFNTTTPTPNLIIGQDTLKVTSNYTFSSAYAYYNITNANVSFTVRYPNGTIILKENKSTINDGVEYFMFRVNETLPIGDDYSVYIFANRSYFKTSSNLLKFNVISGITNESLQGLNTEFLQGETKNITIVVKSIRKFTISTVLTIYSTGLNTYSQLVTINPTGITSIEVNITAKSDAPSTNHTATIIFSRGINTFLTMEGNFSTTSALELKTLLFNSQSVQGGTVQFSLSLKNNLPDDAQLINITFSGDLINTLEDQITFQPNELKSLTYSVLLNSSIETDNITINLNILKGANVIISEEIRVEILPDLSIVEVSFPERVSQGSLATLILVLQNNKAEIQNISLYVNGLRVDLGSGSLKPGLNRIEYSVIPTINPYDFAPKTYNFEVKSERDITLSIYQFTVQPEITASNILFFYVTPLAIPVAVILYYKSKELIQKRLTR